MTKIINKFLLIHHKSIPEMDLEQPGFKFSASGLFTENKKNTKKIKTKTRF